MPWELNPRSRHCLGAPVQGHVGDRLAVPAQSPEPTPWCSLGQLIHLGQLMRPLGALSLHLFHRHDNGWEEKSGNSCTVLSLGPTSLSVLMSVR